MDVFEAIEKRRSVRRYAERPLEPEALETVLRAGRDAPSARNRQEWRFVVVQDADARRAVAEIAEQPWLASAAAIVAVVSTAPEKVMYCGVPAGPVDCAIAIDHMTLAATALGLGSCWIGHFDQDGIRRQLGVPEACEVIELLALGYPADEPGAKDRKPLDEVVRRERFE